MSDLLAFSVVGIVTGAAYAIAATGLVVTYATSNVFNMAHGAVGMVMAFLYWEVAVNRGVPLILALLLVVGVAAPLFGMAVERLMMRRLTSAPPVVSLTVTVGLLVLLIGLAQTIWPPTARRVPRFFDGSGFQLGQVFVTLHEVVTLLLALLVAGALYYLLSRTRTGVAMRAVVDNRELVAINGGRPALLSSLAWGLGSSLAALAGILLVPVVQLDYITLTLLVINAYAAAIVGKLKNLPRTFVGAMVLGLLQSYFLYAQRFTPQDWTWLNGVRAALPTIFLFSVMLLLPQERLRVGAVKGTSMVRLPSRQRAVVSGVLLVVVTGLVTRVVSAGTVAVVGQALALSLIMLSLVVLVGYGGAVSLSQMTFVGFGALVVARYFQGNFSLLSVVVAGLVAAVAGAIVSLPALRLRGLYLALGTLAFAVAMDKLVFENASLGFQLGGNALVERPTTFASEGAFVVLLSAVFAIIGIAVLEVRRGRFGRFLLAIRDSEAACGTLGLNIVGTRVKVFALSAGMAGIGGAMYGGMQVSVGSTDFSMFNSLPLLLLAVVAGITSVTGALVGGLLLGLLPVVQEAFPAIGGAAFLLVGVAAVSLADNPNGLAEMLFRIGRGGRPARADAVSHPRAESSAPLKEVGVVTS